MHSAIMAIAVSGIWDAVLLAARLTGIRLERVRADAVECSFIRDQTTDPSKRELFARLALHLETLAIEVERAKAAAGDSSDKMSLLFRTRANAIQPKTRERQSSPSMPSRQRRQIRRRSSCPTARRWHKRSRYTTALSTWHRLPDEVPNVHCAQKHRLRITGLF